LNGRFSLENRPFAAPASRKSRICDDSATLFQHPSRYKTAGMNCPFPAINPAHPDAVLSRQPDGGRKKQKAAPSGRLKRDDVTNRSSTSARSECIADTIASHGYGGFLMLVCSALIAPTGEETLMGGAREVH
jgi:hypothetical protein